MRQARLLEGCRATVLLLRFMLRSLLDAKYAFLPPLTGFLWSMCATHRFAQLRRRLTPAI